MAKRILDAFSSLFGLVLLSPLLLGIALMIKIGSPGPVLYRGLRVGKDGRTFRMFKFRSMVPDAEKLGGPSTAGDDPRLTKVGMFMKRYQLDELPQLINVLKGEMSLVGPRPEVPMYVDMMTEEEREAILSVKPGITDWASLWNFHEWEILKGSSDPEKTYQEKIRPEKIRLQMKYVQERGFWTDMKILFETIRRVLHL